MQHTDGTTLRITRTLGTEDEATFNDHLYDWMGRAPWFAVSFVVHLLLYFVLAAIPWHHFDDQPRTIITAEMIQPPEELFVEPEEEEVEPLETEPVVEPEVVERPVETQVESESDADEDSEPSPFTSDAFNPLLGIGGGAGNPKSAKVGTRGVRKQSNNPYQPELMAGLLWLADHQSEDGSWDADDYMYECDAEPPYANGKGNGAHDVGVTSLALLALMGYGDTRNDGRFADNIRRGIGWLGRQQEPETGQIGPRSSKEWIYDHALATLALCEAQSGAPNPILRRQAQRAVNFCARARADYGAWRYEVPNLGSADSSVTGWMVFALSAARDAGLTVDLSALEDALTFLDEATDGYGRTGYRQMGEGSSRPRHLIEQFPAEETASLTAVGLLSRLFIADSLGLELDAVAGGSGGDCIALGVERLLEHTPHWPTDLRPRGDESLPEGRGGVDHYGWYYGTYALFQLSDRYPSAWREWERALESAVLPTQRVAPACFVGSWDPIDPWSDQGGRVYSTALMVLCLEAHFRYGKLFGSR